MFIDKGEPIAGEFAICFPNGCFAETKLNGATIATLKRAQTATVQVRNQANVEVNFTVPLKDFAAAFDGPPVDPKVLAQKNQELQKQLEEKARLQREQLEKQSAQPAPPTAPQPPAARNRRSSRASDRSPRRRSPPRNRQGIDRRPPYGR